MKKMRRVLSIILAAVMVLMLCCVPAVASGEPSGAPGGSGGPGGPGGAPGEGTGATDTEVVTLIPEEVDEFILEGTVELTTDVYTERVELVEDAEISAPYPVIVFYGESDTVENGTIVNNVQFVSDYDEVIAVVHTNDVHGHIEVEPYVKGLADTLKASGDYSLVLTVSAGDIYGGGEAVAGSYNGELIPAIMDRVYDALCPGNNDFGAPGVARQNILLSRLYEHTQTLFANVETQDGGLALAEYAVNYEPVVGAELFDALYEKVSLNGDGSVDLSALEMADLGGKQEAYQKTATYITENGTTVGLFGLCTTGGALAVDLDSLGSVVSAQTCVNELRGEGASVVIGVGHTGWMGEGATTASSNDTNSWQLANNVTGLDAFVDGHTHSIINKGQGVFVGSDPTFVNQAQSFGYCIGIMYLYVKDGEVIAVDGDVITDMSEIPPDAGVQSLVDMTLAKVKEDFGKPITETPHFLNGERMSSNNEGGTVRGNETNLGDLVTDVILAAASEKMGVDYDFCVYPGYWIRASIEAGDITMESIQGVFANPTVLYYDTYTGQGIVDLVTKALGTVYPEGEASTFNQYAGIRVTYTNDGGVGTPVTITVGDTPVYDAYKGGLLMDESWTCEGVLTMTGGEIDDYTGDMANWICHDKTEVHTLVADWFESHTAEDYTVYPNTVAPNGRIAEVSGASEEAADMALMEEQLVGLTGVKNARQLDGYVTEDGRSVKENVFIRSGSLAGATAEDLAILTDDYNVKLIVDFRSASDFEASSDPVFNGAVIVNIPVWDENLNAIPQTEFNALQAEFSGEPGRADLELYRRGYMGVDEDLYIKQTFQNNFSLEGYREFIDLLLAQEEDTGILFHCTSGKDRTGSAAVILLTLLGVDRETVLKDFAITNLVLKDSLDEKVARSANYTDDEDELYAVFTMNGVNPDWMARLFDYAEAQSGSMLAYIQQQLHVTDEGIAVLRDKYLE